MGLSLVNEGGLQFITHVTKGIPVQLKPALQAWLQARYSDGSSFEKTWGQALASLNSPNFILPVATERSARMDDVLAFYTELQGQTAQWMEQHVRSLGSSALVTAYNNMSTTHAMHTREKFSWIDMHAYHDEGFGFKAGAKIRNDSSFDKGLQYIADLSTARLAGRAFTVSEYGQPFWNEWRRESALVAPSYAAFQDWGAICQHASTAVDLTYAQSKGWKQSIIPYAVGLDPVGRVVETLAALLYRRGDVKTGGAEVQIVLPGGAGESSSRYWGMPANLGRIALVSKVQTRPAAAPAAEFAPLASVLVAPEDQAGRKLTEWSTQAGANLGSGTSSIDRIGRLQDTRNTTAAITGVYESGTGELVANMNERSFLVKTPLTRGLVFEKLSEPFALGPLSLTSADQPSLVALSSLDRKPLSESASMLLIAASDALNTNMRFTDTTRRELVSIGRLPVRVANRNFTFQIPGASHLRVSALKSNGEVSEAIPLKTSNGKSTLTIDLSNLSAGPTFYFHVEIVKSTH
ncbi:MAG: hypothetical protein PHF58_13230 [Methylotenera sp.]|nr:hypothetical protein [Methylotenera sp.]